ncbi:MAG: lysophospholipid acyltransferase family protein, partial [Planctomycetota bacterium]|nr:lysophospholipid acyltransferase family protein [Planctomycetota bacterium]
LLFAEFAAKDRLLGPPSQPCPRLRSGGDYSRVDADIARGGGLVVTAHLGNWEIAAEAVRRHGVDLKAMARSVDDSLVEAWLVRRRGGATALIPKTGGTAHVLRAIRSGTWVAVLADQNAGRHGLFVPFFGLEASTYPTPAAIALRLGVPIYFGTCVRRPGLEGFDTHIERLPDPDPTQPYDEAVRAITLDLTRRTEAAIRRAPEQYNWIHRRWKTRPPGRDGSEPGQPFYARLWPADHPRTHLHETA